jgi:hypothetical protein
VQYLQAPLHVIAPMIALNAENFTMNTVLGLPAFLYGNEGVNSHAPVMQVYDRVVVRTTVGGRGTTIPTFPPLDPSAAVHASNAYNKSLVPLGWFYGNQTFNVSTATVWLAGVNNTAIDIQTRLCPEAGCSSLGTVAADVRWVRILLIQAVGGPWAST